MKDFEKPMLISLVIVLGLILYMRLLKSLKKKKASANYITINGYDVKGTNVEIRYSSPEAIDAEFIFNDDSNNEISKASIAHPEKGSYSYLLPIPSISKEVIHFHCETSNQKISKKIYLTI
jgi:hypothetical protein